MRYVVACDSTTGAVRDVNQDAVAYLQAAADGDEVVLAIICDGMGGYEQGEFASTTVVKAYMDWFREVFLKQTDKMCGKRLRKDWTAIANLLNQELYQYGKEHGISVGTTATMLLLWKRSYYVFHIGDTRAYKIGEIISQITCDHSVVAREVALGHITKEEARFDPRSNQILRCIGGHTSTKGDFYTGEVRENTVFLLCCDGVRNKVYDEELLYYFHPSCMTSKENLLNNIKYIFELNISRGESDNMSVIAIKVQPEDTADGKGAAADKKAESVEEALTEERRGKPVEKDGQMIVNSAEYIGLEFGKQ